MWPSEQSKPATECSGLGITKAALPSMTALLRVATFWVVGLVSGSIHFAVASTLKAMRTRLPMMLAAVAVSIIIAFLAIDGLLDRHVRTRPRP